MALLPGNLAPRQQEHLAHRARWMPFEKAAQMIEELLGVQTNRETTRQLTERMGASMEAVQTAGEEAVSLQKATEQPALPQCALSADGAMVSLLNKQWVETRTVAIGLPHKKVKADGEIEIHVEQLSYFSRLADAFTFTRLAEVEIRRRRVAQAQEVCAVMDGADWLQCFTDAHRPDAMRILDFPHAAERVTKLLEALTQAGVCFPARMLDRCLHLLKHRGPRPLLRLAGRLEKDLAQQRGIQEHLDYLRKREALMNYPLFRQHGWPIGSGMVESANKNVVEARLKGTGMHWERKHVNPMLAVRNAVCNDRWKEMWQETLTHRQQQQMLRRQAQAKQRASARLSDGLASPEESSAPSPAVTESPLTPGSLFPSGQTSGETCICGVPLIQGGKYRPKQYCSNRCRIRACRQRQSQKPASSCPSRDQEAFHQTASYPVQNEEKTPAGVCFCGTALIQSGRYRPKQHCSDRCRIRACRQRQASQS